MRLDRVELVGFKSFCDKQELTFEGGVTGIVGPNGCGKSNISDAISWVLGEQSAKSLRGVAMADVIFNGSQARQPVGMAEVSLKVSGLNGNSPDGSPECVVTRRLYRNGESEYSMNGRICRLRDIHELFMDTGLGSKAYSIIEQGKIGLILSSKPTDRRSLIEEAAGITKYKARRRQTQLKLDAAQQNLLRVNDIVHEVERQLEGLKRQAGKARRYRALREEMQGLERILFGRRFLDLQQQALALGERTAAEEQREAAASLALETEEAQLEARRVVLYDEDAVLESLRARQAELTLLVDRHQGRSGFCKQQGAEAGARAAESAAEQSELEGRVLPLRAHLEARQGEEARVQDELEQAALSAQENETALQRSAARQAALEAEQEAARDDQLTVMGRSAALQNARQSVSGNAERASGELLKLATEVAELARERERSQGDRQQALARIEQQDTLRAELQRAREDAVAREQEARRSAERQHAEVDQVESERDSLAGRLASLQEIVETHAAFDEGVRALLTPKAAADAASAEAAPAPAGPEVIGVLADSVETDSAYERAVETFLDDRLQAVLVKDTEQALSGIRALEATGAGRAAFLPVASAPRGGDALGLRAVAEMEPGVLGLLGDFYRVAGPHAEAIRACLPEALLVGSVEDAVAVAGATPASPASRWRARPCSEPGSKAGGWSRACWRRAGRSARPSVRREEMLERLRGLRAGEAEVLAAADKALLETRALDSRIHDLEKELVAARHDLAAAEEELRRSDRKASLLEVERDQAERDQGAAAVRLAEIEQALLEVEAQRASGSERLARLQSGLAEARAATDAAQAAASEAKSALATLRERGAAMAAERERLLAEQQELTDRIAAAGQRTQESLRRQQELLAEMQEAERLLAAALLERDQAGEDTARAEDRVREVRNELDAREHSLKERRRERETLRDALSELTVARARAESDLDHLQRECQQAVGNTAAEAATGLGEADVQRDQSELLTQVDEIRGRIDKMGPVNVLAVEQSQELEERHQFLTAQRQDLLDSVAEMEQAIRKIDRASRERFQDAFNVINQHFGEIFQQLFGGGTAGLSLVDEQDLLESGIDVMAQPPGKRLQNVMLLSGGEKALTAIALLFAIFQYKPSPFCILDEVDAPLDDANVGRFVRMLEGLKDKTQFVLITHSRKTMEIADQLYGVTMEEPGVSKLVSVKFS